MAKNVSKKEHLKTKDAGKQKIMDARRTNYKKVKAAHDENRLHVSKNQANKIKEENKKKRA